jgi:hypothetical protein
MNPFIWFLLGFGAGGALGYKLALDKRNAEPKPAPLPIPTLTPTNIPPITLPPPSNFAIGVPASPIEIPGGNYINGIGWCPPGWAYNLATQLCEPQSFPTFTRTTGCNDETCDCHRSEY